MKLFDVDVDNFTKVLGQCEGQVVMITEDGDRLVTNSMLSALVGLSQILKVASLKEVEFEFEKPQDGARVLNYLMKHMKSEE